MLSFSLNNSFIPDISIAPLQVHYYSEALLTTALVLCWSYHTEALWATVSEGLAQGPYVAAGVGFKLRPSAHKAPNLTTEPPRPTSHNVMAVLLQLQCQYNMFIT